MFAFSGTLDWVLEAIWPLPVESNDAEDIGAIYLIEGLERSGAVASDGADLGEKGSRPESEKTALQHLAVTHGRDVSM